MTGLPLRPVDSPFRGPGGTPSARSPRHSRESGNPGRPSAPLRPPSFLRKRESRPPPARGPPPFPPRAPSFPPRPVIPAKAGIQEAVRHYGHPCHSRPAPRHSRESGNPVPRPHHAPPPILPHPPPGDPPPAGRQPISRAAPIAYCAIVNNSVTYLTVALTTGQSFSPILAFGSREDTLKPRYNRPQAPGPRPQAPGPRPQAPFRARRTPPGLSDSDMKNRNRPASPLPLTRKGAW